MSKFTPKNIIIGVHLIVSSATFLNILKIMIAIILLILLMIMGMGGGVVSKFNYSQAEQLPPRIHLIIIIIVSLSSSDFHVFIIIFRCDSIS